MALPATTPPPTPCYRTESTLVLSYLLHAKEESLLTIFASLMSIDVQFLIKLQKINSEDLKGIHCTINCSKEFGVLNTFTCMCDVAF